jgi:hypothetical protein
MKSSLGIMLPLVLLISGSAPGAAPGLEGEWKFVPGRSTDIAPWNYSQPQLAISSAEGSVRVIQNWLDRGRIAYADTFEFRPGGGAVSSSIRSHVWPENWYMGVLAAVEDARTVSGLWLEQGTALRVVTRQTLLTSQGKTAITTTRDYTLAPGGKTLTVTERRSSRPSPVVLVFERSESSQ